MITTSVVICKRVIWCAWIRWLNGRAYMGHLCLDTNRLEERQWFQLFQKWHGGSCSGAQLSAYLQRIYGVDCTQHFTFWNCSKSLWFDNYKLSSTSIRTWAELDDEMTRWLGTLPGVSITLTSEANGKDQLGSWQPYLRTIFIARTTAWHQPSYKTFA